MTKSKAEERAAARERLRTMLPPGATVYCVLRSVSRSGMTRRIDFYAMINGHMEFLSGFIGKVLGLRRSHNEDGLVVHGVGMDAGMHVVYELAYRLYPDGFTCTGEACPSNDHSNGDRDYTPHQHKESGYALRHEWL